MITLQALPERYPSFESRTVSTRYGIVSGVTHGEGDVSVLFLHGLSGNCQSFGWQLHALASSCRAVTWDAPGYGNTSLSKADIDDYATRALALMDALDHNRFFVVGHSMGGVVAGRLAARFPDRITGVLLSCTHTGYAAPAGTGLTDGHKQRLDEAGRLSPQEYGAARARNMVAPGADKDVLDNVARIAGTTTRPGLENAIRTILEANNTDLMRALSVPATVLAGELDQIAPRAKTDRLGGLIPHARRVILPDTAHAPYLEKPHAFNRALVDALQSANWK